MAGEVSTLAGEDSTIRWPIFHDTLAVSTISRPPAGPSRRPAPPPGLLGRRARSGAPASPVRPGSIRSSPLEGAPREARLQRLGHAAHADRAADRDRARLRLRRDRAGLLPDRLA